MTGEASDFTKMVTLTDVAAWFELPNRELTWWIWGLPAKRRYTKFEIAKRSGDGSRTVRAPIKPIKDLQRGVAEVLTQFYEPPPYTHGFVLERSQVSNAVRHRSQEWVVKFDLRDFFPHIHFGRVWGMFQAHPFDFPPPVATALAQICCADGELPQGAPSSPIISNFICRGLDGDLAKLAGRNRCYYTRYADDITFSTDRKFFPDAICEMRTDGAQPGGEFARIVSAAGFELNPQKLRVAHRSRRQLVTGLVVNERPNIRREHVRGIRTVLHVWKTRDEAAAKEVFEKHNPVGSRHPDAVEADWKLRFRGQVQHLGNVRTWADPVYDRFAEALEQLDDGFKRKPRLHGVQKSVTALTEGTTDLVLLQAALRWFQEREEFLDLTIEGDPQHEPRGEGHLRKKCEALALQRHQRGVIGVFDHDLLSFVRNRFKGSPVQNLRSGVAMMLIAPPEGFSGERYCIESLFDRDDIAQRFDSDRRLFFRDEFHEQSRLDKTGEFRVAAGGSALVAENVTRVADGGSVALSKTRFAEMVSTGLGSFADVSFEGFRPTFRRLHETAVLVESDLRFTN